MFPSKASLATLPDHATKTMFYTPSSKSEFQRQTLTDKDKSESMKDWFSIGKCSNKYMKMEMVPQNLPTRDSASYSQDYRGRPAVDFLDNQELRDMFAPSKKLQVLPQLAAPKTKYSADFVRPTSVQLRRAKGEVSVEAEESSNRTLGGPGEMLVRTSSTSELFAAPRARWVSAPFVPQNNLELTQTDFKPVSQYTVSFSGQPAGRASYNSEMMWPWISDQRSTSAGGRSATASPSALGASMPQPSTVGSAQVHADRTIPRRDVLKRCVSSPAAPVKQRTTPQAQARRREAPSRR